MPEKDRHRRIFARRMPDPGAVRPQRSTIAATGPGCSGACGRIPAVRLSRVLLLVSAGAGALAVTAALFSARQASLQCGLVTLVTLIGYVMVAGRAALPRVRWAIAAGVGLLAVVMAMRLFWYREPAGGLVFDEVFYVSVDGSGAPSAPVEVVPAAVLDQERIAAVGQLLGVLCLAVGVRGLPESRRPKQGVLTTILAALLLVVVGVNIAGRVDGTAVFDLLGTAWPALLATLAAAGVAALTGRRADRARLLPAGALLVAVAQAVAFDNLTGIWSAWWALSDFGGVDSVSATLGVSVDGSPEVSAAMEATVALTGPALLTIGALHASRDTRPVRPRSDAG